MLSVEHSRTGETLTRELKFDTPRDEYAYELDRNDTHKMLVTMLLKDKLENQNTQNRIAGFMEAAEISTKRLVPWSCRRVNSSKRSVAPASTFPGKWCRA
jgi:hypothetical protein